MCLSLITACTSFTLPALLLHLLLATKASSYGHFEDDPEEPSPHIEWVPIVQRNFTEMIHEALLDYETDVPEYRHSQRQRERLVRIGKMLNASYWNMEKDAKAGNEKMRRLEKQRQNTTPSHFDVDATAGSSAVASKFPLPNNYILLVFSVLPIFHHCFVFVT